MTTFSVLPDGVDLTSLTPGSLLDVETRRRHYRIECLGGNEIRISGHPELCPDPVPAHLHGSIGKDGVLELGIIGRDKRLMFFLEDNHRPVTTSKVVSVHVEQPRANPSIATIH